MWNIRTNQNLKIAVEVMAPELGFRDRNWSGRPAVQTDLVHAGTMGLSHPRNLTPPFEEKALATSGGGFESPGARRA
jgi:hypothetical protein